MSPPLCDVHGITLMDDDYVKKSAMDVMLKRSLPPGPSVDAHTGKPEDNKHAVGSKVKTEVVGNLVIGTILMAIIIIDDL